MATAARIGISHELLPLPGDSITEALEEHALSVEVASEKLNVNPDYLEKVITGLSPISVALAKKLSRLLDIPESFWLNLQNDYDEALLALDKAEGIDDEEKNTLTYVKEIQPGVIVPFSTSV